MPHNAGELELLSQETVPFEGATEESVVPYEPVIKDLHLQILKEFERQISNAGVTDVKVKDRIYETLLFNAIKEMPTPLEVIKLRKGADGGEYEYFDEHYTNQELDRLFPGWWTDDMKTWYDSQTQAYITTGYLFIEYTLPSGEKKIRKVYAVGGAKVYAKRSSLENGLPEASQPEDRAIASFTRWKKLAGKQLGIGLDIYHQRITPYLHKEYERRTAPIWHKWKTDLDKIFNSLTTGKGARKLIKSLAEPEEYEKISRILLKLEAGIPKEKYEQLVNTCWTTVIQNKETIPSIITQLNQLLERNKSDEPK